METNRAIRKCTVVTEANDAQQLIAAVILMMLVVALTGPIPIIQLTLWVVLCFLFAILGYKLVGDALWK